MKLHPPQVELNLYEDGFGTDDLLGRRSSGRQLSELLERIEDPVVLALDGPWGSGKTHFLRRWVGAHSSENGGHATTVYFDAFSNDYLDDPLIGLTGAIGERLPSNPKKNHWKKAKTVAFKLARPALRIGAAAATSGLTEVTGPVLDAIIETGGKEMENAAEAFWKREDGRRAAMHQFREALKQITSSSDSDETKPLIVVIDELDRCRPDYALSVLEVVKHFFAVPRVHFVLGVNLEALAHIVRTRYGVGVDANDYLKRFITISMQLPNFVEGQEGKRPELKYFERSAEHMGIEKGLSDVAKNQLDLAVGSAKISLRDVERILTRLALLPKRNEIGNFLWGWKELIVSLVLLQVMRPTLFEAAFGGTIKVADINDFYGISPEISHEARGSGKYSYYAYLIHGLWSFVLNTGKFSDKDREQFSKAFDQFGLRETDQILSRLQRDFFSTFEILAETH